jgi:TrmH family RNA methyltransferase
VVKMKKTEHGLLRPREWQGQTWLTLILDGINDPGNLGTIIRTADWYVITHIIASLDTVDCYSSKVIMATMWSFTRIKISYLDLEKYLSSLSWSAIYWAYLDGESAHEKNFSHTPAYLVIGSESHGIRPPLEKYITDKITIPCYGEAESLNAWVATAIILDNLRREISRKKV